jgi:diguanylate cyclase (GGDEF)-like protein
MPALSRRTTTDGRSVARSRVPLSRRFTYRYATALLLFIALALVWKLSIDSSSQRISDLTAQARQASLQPTRLTKIGDLANRVVFSSTADSLPKLSGDLTREANNFKNVQAGLVAPGGDPALGLPPAELDTTLEHIYFEPDRLKQTVDEISNAALTITNDVTFANHDEAARQAKVTEITDRQDDAERELDKANAAYANLISNQVRTQQNNNDIMLGLSILVTIGVVLLLMRPMARNIHFETSQLEDAERMHRENNERQTFRNELSQALEVTDSEGEVLAAVGRAMMNTVPDHKSELLLTDASQSHLRTAQVSPSRGAAACPVESPQGCAAIRRGQTVVYESSRMLNVCPKLPAHEPSACSAVCVPVMFMGSALGVLHTVGEDGHPPSQTEIERLTVLASESGNRLGLLRHSQATELQATTDGLTGLFNRRSLESKARGMLLDNQPFSIAMADLDRFKNLNDTHGHEAGDRALRTFAQVLRNSLRPEDISSRYGGEEFIVLLPHTSIGEAVRALERLQTALSLEVSKTGGLAFTASWGLTDSSSGQTFDEIVAVADAALYSAKRAGRDCIMVDSEAAAAAAAQIELPTDPPPLSPKPGPTSAVPGPQPGTPAPVAPKPVPPRRVPRTTPAGPVANGGHDGAQDGAPEAPAIAHVADPS